jgi:hypothetical protein
MKILSISIIGILVLSGTGAFALDKSNGETEVIEEEILISQPIIKSIDEEYVSVNLNEAKSSLLETGKPMLPVITKVFTFPFGSNIQNVEVYFSDEHEICLSNNIKTTSEINLPKSIPITNKVENNNNIDENYKIYPKENYKYTTGAGLKGNDHVIYCAVHCYPIKYLPVQNKIIYNDKAAIKISYKPPDNPVIFDDEFDLLIISPEEFSQKLQPLIDHKNNHGIQATLKTIEDIYDEYEGFDNAEQIKYFIKDAVENWGISYVFLVGDIYKLPIRESAVLWKYFDDIITEEVLTDLYYADLYDANSSFCCWDSNENGIYGEFIWDAGSGDISYIDDVDLYSDIYIGRAPCATKREVQIIVDKIIHYETKSYGEEWFNRVICMGGDTFPNMGEVEGEYITEIIAQTMQGYGFDPIKLWASTNDFKPLIISLQWTRGAGFISYSGHGGENGFSTTSPIDGKHISYQTLYLLGVLNRYKLPIIFFEACSTTTLDYNRFGIKLPCFAWATLKKPRSGSIATFGCTRPGWPGFIEDPIAAGVPYLHVNFFDAYEPETTPSHMFVYAQNEYLNNFEWKDCLTLEETIMLGDPSLRVGGYS